MCNREIHRMVEWLVSESMVMYYIHLFRDSMWPGGELAKPATPRTETVSLVSIFSALWISSSGYSRVDVFLAQGTIPDNSSLP